MQKCFWVYDLHAFVKIAGRLKIHETILVWRYDPMTVYVMFGSKRKTACQGTNQNEFQQHLNDKNFASQSCLHFIGLPERSIWGGHHYVGGEQAADRWCIVLLHSPAHWRKRPPSKVHSFMVLKKIELISENTKDQLANVPMFKNSRGDHSVALCCIVMDLLQHFKIHIFSWFLCVSLFLYSCLPQKKKTSTSSLLENQQHIEASSPKCSMPSLRKIWRCSSSKRFVPKYSCRC